MAFYGAEQVLDSIKSFIVSDIGVHISAVEAAASATLTPAPITPIAADIFLSTSAIDFQKPLGRRVAIVLNVGEYDEADIPNGITRFGVTMSFFVSAPSGRPENMVRRLGRYIESAHRLFDTDATCGTAYIIQVRYAGSSQFSPEFDVSDSSAIYQQAFLPLMIDIQENAA